MSKLTKKQRDHLERVLTRLSQAERYIMQTDVAISKRGKATTSLHYVRPDGEALYEVNKQAGSELAQLFTAKHELEDFLKGAI